MFTFFSFQIIVLILNFKPLLSYSINGSFLFLLNHNILGYAIRDLEKNDSSFAYDAELWTTSSQINGLQYSICSGTYLLGGIGVLGELGMSAKGQYFERIYTALPTHYMIYFSFTFWAIDTWDASKDDAFQLQFDNRLLNGWVLGALDFPDTGHVCGLVGAKDLRTIRVYGRAYHTGQQISIRVISQLDQWPSDESFGFRDLNLLLVSSPIVKTESLCGLASISLNSNQCSCPEGQYEYPLGSGTCISCHSNCKSCFGLSSRSCYECAPNMYFNGVDCLKCYAPCSTCFGEANYQCISCKTGAYKVTSGTFTTCVTSCDLPLVQSVVSGVAYCQSPCSSTTYAYWNGSCLPSCDYPLQKEIVLNLRQCINPCATNQYLYWNGSCHPTCETPFIIIDQGDIRYCVVSCASNEFLYYDGSCSPICDPPLSQETLSQKKICRNPCQAGEFLYNNGSCLSACHLPLSKREQNGVWYCEYPCGSSEYVMWNCACTTSCGFPLRVKNEPIGKFCIAPCDNPTDYYNEVTSKCQAQCSFLSFVDEKGLFLKCSQLKVADEGTFVHSLLLAPIDSEAISLVSLVKFLHYLRFLDVQIPSRLDRLVRSPSRSLFCLRLFPKMSKEMEQIFPFYKIPDVFRNRGLHSNFLVNFWGDFFSLAVIAGAMMIFILFENLCKSRGSEDCATFFERLRVILGWSFFLITLTTNLGDIILYASLQINAANFGSFLGMFSLIVCIGIIVLIAIFLNKIIDIIDSVHTAKIQAWIKRSNEVYWKGVITWQNYQIFYRGYKDSTLFNQFFYLFYVIRIALPMVFAAFLYSVPLLQIILYILLSVLTIAYIVFKKPLQSKVNHIQVVILEILFFIVNILALILVAFDLSGSDDEIGRIFIGDLLILANDSINLHLFLFFLIKLFLAIKKASKIGATQPTNQRAAWLQIFFLPLQQGGMGFEKAQFASFSNLRISKATADHDDDPINESIIFLENIDSSKYKEKEKGIEFPKQPIKRYRLKQILTSEDELEFFRKDGDEIEYIDFGEMASSQITETAEDTSSNSVVLQTGMQTKKFETNIEEEKENETMPDLETQAGLGVLDRSSVFLVKEPLDMTPDNRISAGDSSQINFFKELNKTLEDDVKPDDRKFMEESYIQVEDDEEEKRRRIKRKDNKISPNPRNFEDVIPEPQDEEIDRDIDEEEQNDNNNYDEGDIEEEKEQYNLRKIKRNNPSQNRYDKKQNIFDDDEEEKVEKEYAGVKNIIPQNGEMKGIERKDDWPSKNFILENDQIPDRKNLSQGANREFGEDFDENKVLELRLKDYALFSQKKDISSKKGKQTSETESRRHLPQSSNDIAVVNVSYNENNFRKKLKMDLRNEEQDDDSNVGYDENYINSLAIQLEEESKPSIKQKVKKQNNEVDEDFMHSIGRANQNYDRNKYNTRHLNN